MLLACVRRPSRSKRRRQRRGSGGTDGRRAGDPSVADRGAGGRGRRIRVCRQARPAEGIPLNSGRDDRCQRRGAPHRRLGWRAAILARYLACLPHAHGRQAAVTTNSNPMEQEALLSDRTANGQTGLRACPRPGTGTALYRRPSAATEPRPRGSPPLRGNDRSRKPILTSEHLGQGRRRGQEPKNSEASKKRNPATITVSVPRSRPVVRRGPPVRQGWVKPALRAPLRGSGTLTPARQGRARRRPREARAGRTPASPARMPPGLTHPWRTGQEGLTTGRLRGTDTSLHGRVSRAVRGAAPAPDPSRQELGGSPRIRRCQRTVNGKM